MKSMLLTVMWVLVSFQSVFAIDPGTVQGTFQVNTESIQLTQAYAHLHDNAEGLLDRPKELRIVLADREVPQEALAGIAFLPVEDMAKEGRVRGLLLKLDPADRHLVLVTLLYPPANPGESLMTLTLTATGSEIMKKLQISDHRLTGEIEHSEPNKGEPSEMRRMNFALRFSAPLFHELPITADLKGKAAQDSPQVQILREKARAMVKGDFEALKQLSSAHANRHNEAFFSQAGEQARTFAKEAGAEMEGSIKNVQRVVVRGERAVVIFSDKEWMTFVREGGTWKSDD